MPLVLKEKLVRVDRRESFALVIFDCPANGNAISAALMNELSDALTELQTDKSIRAIILTGAGNVFSSGMDAEEISLMNPEQARTFSRSCQWVAGLIEGLGKPVIAAINGQALGSGCDLALACAWRIASPSAVFSYPETYTAMIPGSGGTMRLPQIVGSSRALEIILTGEIVNAGQALNDGLINRMVDSDNDLLPVCEELCRQISRNAPLAIKYAMEAVNLGGQMNLANGLLLESAIFGLCFATEDVQEGTRAFLEKRAPNFKGR